MLFSGYRASYSACLSVCQDGIALSDFDMPLHSVTVCISKSTFLPIYVSKIFAHRVCRCRVIVLPVIDSSLIASCERTLVDSRVRNNSIVALHHGRFMQPLAHGTVNSLIGIIGLPEGCASISNRALRERKDTLYAAIRNGIGYCSRCMFPRCAAAILSVEHSFNHFAPSRIRARSALRIEYIVK